MVRPAGAAAAAVSSGADAAVAGAGPAVGADAAVVVPPPGLLQPRCRPGLMQPLPGLIQPLGLMQPLSAQIGLPMR